MLKKWIDALTRAGELVETCRGLAERLEKVERDMESSQLDWDEMYGKVRRVLNRINRANQRNDEEQPAGSNGASHSVIGPEEYGRILQEARARYRG